MSHFSLQATELVSALGLAADLQEVAAALGESPGVRRGRSGGLCFGMAIAR